MSTRLDLTIDQGSLFKHSFTVTDEDGNIIGDLTGFGVRAQCRKNIEDAAVAFSLNGDVVTPASAACRVYLDGPDNENLTPGVYVYDIEVYSGSTIYRPYHGFITVTRQVTRT